MNRIISSTSEAASEKPRRGVLTMAYGPPKFIALARNLALSLRLNDPTVPLAIVTDSDDPEIHQLYDFVIPMRPEWGRDFHQKRHLQDYSPFQCTLFIDSDCLVLRRLDEVWNLFEDAAFGVIGWRVTEGATRYHQDTAQLLARMERPWLPLFNEGFYYFDDTPDAADVFRTIARVMDDYDEWGLNHVGRKRGIEPPMAVTLSLLGIEPKPEDNRTANHTYYLFGPMKIDVLRGVCRFYCRQRKTVVEPKIVHLLWPLFEEPVYRREVIKMRLAWRWRLPRRLTSALVNGAFNPPYAVYAAFVRGYKRLRTGVPIMPLPLWPVRKPWPEWMPPWRERQREQRRRKALRERIVNKFQKMMGRASHSAAPPSSAGISKDHESASPLDSNSDPAEGSGEFVGHVPKDVD